MKQGLVIKSTGKFYSIREAGSKDVHNAIIRGKFKIKGLKLTNPVAVGDNVDFTSQERLRRK